MTFASISLGGGIDTKGVRIWRRFPQRRLADRHRGYYAEFLTLLAVARAEVQAEGP